VLPEGIEPLAFVQATYNHFDSATPLTGALAEHSKLVQRAAEIVNDKWGPAVALRLKAPTADADGNGSPTAGRRCEAPPVSLPRGADQQRHRCGAAPERLQRRIINKRRAGHWPPRRLEATMAMKCIILVPVPQSTDDPCIYVQCGHPSQAGMCNAHIAMLSTARPRFVLAKK